MVDFEDKLFPYQIEGYKWIIGLQKGGILADDMGLGKTVQIIASLSQMMKTNQIKNCLIVCPLSVINSWKEEFAIWNPELKVKSLHGMSKAKRQSTIRSIINNDGICITNYDQIRCDNESFKKLGILNITWHLIVLDEGHKLKEIKTNTFQAIDSLKSMKRIILTGTALQNNLRELYNLFFFIFGEDLFGSYSEFKSKFERPITQSRTKDANQIEQIKGKNLASELKKIIKPFYLRRTKKELQIEGNSAFSLNVMKNDLIIWIQLSNFQLDLYKRFIMTKMVKEVREKKLPPLTLLLVLAKICNHPRLLQSIITKSESMKEFYDDIQSKFINDDENHNYTRFLYESSKLNFLSKLCQMLKLDRKRALIFSRSTKILDMIEATLSSYNMKYLRLDGKISKLTERLNILKSFKNDKDIDFLLLTTQVGGVGLTITSADRVIIFDPSWNYSSDSQAVDRVYRYGQKKDVIIYRLLCSSTIEEKIYRRQIFKESLFKTTACSDEDPLRYFTKDEIYTLFDIGDIKNSETCNLLQNLHEKDRKRTLELDEHIKKIKAFDEVVGISDHDCLFAKDNIESTICDLEINKISEAQTKSSIRMDTKCMLNHPLCDLENSLLNLNIDPRLDALPPRDIKTENSTLNRIKIKRMINDHKNKEDKANNMNNSYLKSELIKEMSHITIDESENESINDSNEKQQIKISYNKDYESIQNSSSDMMGSNGDFEIKYIQLNK